MDTFQITIQRASEGGWPVVVEWSDSKTSLPVRNDGMFQIDQTALDAQVTPRDYGAILGQALFRNNIRDAFMQARTRSEGYLCVLLFVEDVDLRKLRWERLCAPLDGGWDFLSLNQHTPFSLYLPSATERRFRPFGRRDLRALIVVASPEGLERYGLAPFDVEAAVTNVQTALGEIPCDILATVKDAVGPPTLDAICEHITTTPYTLLHIVCHGRYQDKDRETVLYLAGAKQQVEAISATRLVERLKRLGGTRGLPHFAFLATCESASPQAEGVLGGLAQRLVRELGMPAVLAMTEQVSLSTAQALARPFYRQLRTHGKVDLALAEACAGLAERSDITVPALYSRLGARPLFTDALDRELSSDDIRLGLPRLKDLFLERAPILWQPLQEPFKTVQGSLGTTATLSEEGRSERKRALEEINLYCLEALGISFHALALGQDPQPYDSRCPFRGLAAFGPEHQEFFFGREVLIERLQLRLRRHPFLAVVGSSGSGKSSLVLAGVVPALQRTEPGLQLGALNPGSEPLEQLQVNLAHVDGKRPCVLVVDQFEELFTLCSNEQQRRAFLEALLALVPKYRVIITMRADFIAECASYQSLKVLMQEHLELVAPMDPIELRRAMELQVAAVGLRFDADLSSRVLDDVEREPAAMPLLQHALLELWKRRHGYWLRAEEYRAIGGIQQAIARTADTVYDELDPAEQNRTREIFLRLTKPDLDALPGEERRDTRQRVWLEELVPVGSELETTKGLVKRLADARLVVTGLNSVTGHEEVEVAHEALIRHWPRLRTWLNEERDSLRLRARLREAAREWERQGRPTDLLYRGSQLEEAQAWAKRNMPSRDEIAFLEAGAAERQKQEELELNQRARELNLQRRVVSRQRTLITALSIFSVIVIVLGSFAGFNYVSAENQRGLAVQAQQTAVAETQIARSRALVVYATDALSQNQLDRALLLSVKASQTANTSETRNNLIDTLQQSPQIIAMLRGQSRDIHTLAFSRDGGMLVSSDIHGASAWKVSTREPRPLRLGGTLEIGSVALSSDDRTLAFSNNDGAWLWDIETDKQIDILEGKIEYNLANPPLHTSIAFSPNGSLVASARCNQYSSSSTNPNPTCVETSIQLLKVLSKPHLSSSFTVHGDVNSLAFSPDGKLLTSSSDTSIQFWNVVASQPSDVSLIGNTGANSVTFSWDGKTLAAGNKDGTVQLWDVASGHPAIGSPLSAHTGPITSVAFSPDGKTLAASSIDKTVQLWSIASGGQPLATLNGDGQPKTKVAFSPDGRTLASGSENGTTILWNIDADSTISQRVGNISGWWSALLSPDGAILFTGSDDGKIFLHDAKTGKFKGVFDTMSVPQRTPKNGVGHNLRAIRSLALSGDGGTLASGRADGTIVLWSTKTGVSFAQFVYPSFLDKIVLSSNGQFLVAGGGDTIAVWNVAKGAFLYSLPYQEDISLTATPLALSPNGKLLALGGCGKVKDGGCEQGQVQLWDVATGKRLGPPSLGHQFVVGGVAFSPDGATLASSSQDGIILWNVSTRKPIGKILSALPSDNNTSPDYYSNVLFSLDGKILASYSSPSPPFSFVLWDVPQHEALTPVFTQKDTFGGSIAFSPNSTQLASVVERSSGEVIFTLWDITLRSWWNHACIIANRDLTQEEWKQFIGDEIYDKVCQKFST